MRSSSPQPNLPSLDALTDYRPKVPLRIYTADHVLIGEFGEERRSLVRIQDVPGPAEEGGARHRGRALLRSRRRRPHRHPARGHGRR